MSFGPTSALDTRTSVALRDDFLRSAVRFTVDKLRGSKAISTEALGSWEEWRDRGSAIRAHTIANLDHYLEQFSANATARGARVHFASDAEEARRIVVDVVRQRAARRVVKSKSMLSEEIGINEALEETGVDVVETDLGEWIVQLAHETPSHIILPAIHKQRSGIQALFEAEGHEKLSPETKVLAGYARRRLRQKFQQAEVGITGCNFAIAETGSVVLFTNEGNGRMVTTLPDTHIVLMGMERIVPTWSDLEVMANLLPRSATGQKLTTYLNILSGPKGELEVDGAGDVHIIIIDNGRSRLLGDRDFQDVLHCIRCGACLNVCPVYRHIGGHAYGSVYSGPIGAVLTPLLRPTAPAGELANASTLCGACYEACPVKIPLHDMLVQLRRKNVEQGHTAPAEKVAFQVYAAVFSTSWLFQLVGWIARWLQRLFLGNGTRRRWLTRWMGPLRGWTDYRALPPAAPRSLHALWKRRKAPAEGERS